VLGWGAQGMKYLVPIACCLTLTTAALPPAVSADTDPRLSVLREGGTLRLAYAGVLESASDPRGPWLTVSNAANPHPVDPGGGGGPRYYRTRSAPVGDGGLFSETSVARWFLEGPFQDYFEKAYAGLPDGIFPPRREKPYFTGHVVLQGQLVPVSLRVRGNSSLQECPFPKLKLKVAREDRTNTPLAVVREVKIGTHCADGGRGNVGRLRDEVAAYREAVAYELQALLGFTTPRVRRAEIEYHDTSAPGENGAEGWQLRRQALLLEDIEVLADRLGGRALSDDEITALRGIDLGEQLTVDLQLFQTLLGNWDYALPRNGEGLWNFEVVLRADGSYLPIAGDFDLASWVTGQTRLSAPHDYRPELEPVEREMRYRLEQLGRSVRDPVLAAGRDRFVQKRAALEDWVRDALLDEAGRTNAQRHLAIFFDALAVPPGR